MSKKILIVAAHPDDEILGCGGTAALLAGKGMEIHVCILGEGMPFRGQEESSSGKKEYPAQLKEQAREAGGVIGTKDFSFFDLPDNRFDTVPLLEIIRLIEDLKKRIQPEVVFTHHSDDLNVDHRITFQAVLTATRPLPGEQVREVYSFEIPSSTEWSHPARFRPDLFFDISDTVSRKIEAMKKYREELLPFPHPRSVEGIESVARVWGMKNGVRYAEAFEVVRILKSPGCSPVRDRY